MYTTVYTILSTKRTLLYSIKDSLDTKTVRAIHTEEWCDSRRRKYPNRLIGLECMCGEFAVALRALTAGRLANRAVRSRLRVDIVAQCPSVSHSIRPSTFKSKDISSHSGQRRADSQTSKH